MFPSPSSQGINQFEFYKPNSQRITTLLLKPSNQRGGRCSILFSFPFFQFKCIFFYFQFSLFFHSLSVLYKWGGCATTWGIKGVKKWNKNIHLHPYPRRDHPNWTDDKNKERKKKCKDWNFCSVSLNRRFSPPSPLNTLRIIKSR